MMVKFGWVNRILPYSFVDGPGNRSVVFLQGCPFHCVYCHNPYTVNQCTSCGLCVGYCPSGALSLEAGQVGWDSELCTACDACTDHCPIWSSPRVEWMHVQEVWEKIKENRPFISGVTITGGEPIYQPEFLKALLQCIRSSSSLTTCLETNGHITDAVLETLIPDLNFVMVDLKALTPELHRRITGKSNTLTCRTIERLSEAGVLHQVRTTVVPGLTDSLDEISAIAQFLARIDPNIHFRLLRFRPHGVRGEAASWQSPSDQVMEALVQTAKDNGLADVDRSI